jgi:hypothetical protein
LPKPDLKPRCTRASSAAVFPSRQPGHARDGHQGMVVRALMI